MRALAAFHCILICASTVLLPLGIAKESLYQAVLVGRHVPEEVLPPGQIVNYIDVHYRLVGRECRTDRMDQNSLRASLAEVYTRLGGIAGISVSFPYVADTLPAPGSDDEDGIVVRRQGFTDLEDAIREDFQQYHGINWVTRCGVDQEAKLIDIGSMEWTYNRMVEAALKKTFPHDVRALITYFSAPPEGIHVLKYLPLQAHYADKTVLQLRGRSLLPFGPKKQNLLLVMLDLLDLSSAARIVCINITDVRTETLWLPDAGDVGIANVSLVTMSEDPDGLFGEVLDARLDVLVEKLHIAGLHGVSATVFPTEPTSGSLHDQATAMLGPENTVHTYDRRVKRTPPSAMRPATVLWRLIGAVNESYASVAITLVLAGCIASGLWRLSVMHQRMPNSALQTRQQPGPAAQLPQQDHISHSLDPRLHDSSSGPSLRSHASSDLSSLQRVPAVPSLQHPSPNQRTDPHPSAQAHSAQPSFGAEASLSQLPIDPGQGQTQTSVGDQLDFREGTQIAAAPPINPFDNAYGRSSDSSDSGRQGVGDDSAHAEQGAKGVSSRDRMQGHMNRASAVSGWEIADEDLAMCIRPDGSDWLLGAGAFGKVYRGIKGGVQDVAMKILSYNDDLQLQQFRLEIEMLKSLSFDRNVVQFYGACLHPSRPILVLEYMEGGDLRNALSTGDADPHLKWCNHGHVLAMDVSRGLHFLHERKVRHGDIKSKNVLLTRNAAVAKIADVGMAQILETTLGSQPIQQLPGTFAYAAPELLMGQPCRLSADMFSLGVLLHELVTHTPPVRGQMRELCVPADCPQEIADLIERCMAFDPAARPSARQVFEVIRDTMSHHRLPVTDSAMLDRGEQGSLEGEVARRASMRVALNSL